MKNTLHRWIIPLALFLGYTAAVPGMVFSQKSLKLNVKKGIEEENTVLKSSLKTTQKLVRQMDFYEEGEQKTMSMYFTYDAQGRVIKTENVGYYYKNFFENSVVLYGVNGNTLSVSSSLTKAEAGTSAVGRLNEKGYVEAVTITDEDGFLTNASFEYDENGYPVSYSTDDAYYDMEYSWEEGNIHITYDKGNHSADRAYTYTSTVNKANINFNRMFTETFGEGNVQLEFLGYIGKNDKNLLASVDNITFEYTFDSEGYVTKIKKSNDAVCTAVVFYEESSNPDPEPDPTPGDPATDDDLKNLIDQAPEGTEETPTEIFIPSGDGIVLNKPLDVNKHIRLKGGALVRGNENPYAMLRIRSGYSLELEDITIDGKGVSQKDGSLVVYGKLKLKNGVAIKNCNREETDAPSGAICVAQGGQLTMEGGEIAGNTGAYGSAVYNEGTFTLTAGEISFNNGQIGAVVNNAGGRFIMTGGKIAFNQVTDGCGGVFVSGDCSFSMSGGEISNNEDCALYTWSDLQVGGQAKVNGLILLNAGNRLWVNPALRNNWEISFTDTPPAGTIVASGYDGYQLTTSDYQKITYQNNRCRLKLSGPHIITYQSETAVNEISVNNFRLSISGNQVQAKGLPVSSPFTIYRADGKVVCSLMTDHNGEGTCTLEKGIYLLHCKDQTRKFLVK